MNDTIIFAIVSGATCGAIVALPLIAIYYTLRILLRVVAKSKLSLDEYLELLDIEDNREAP